MKRELTLAVITAQLHEKSELDAGHGTLLAPFYEAVTSIAPRNREMNEHSGCKRGSVGSFEKSGTTHGRT